MKTNTRKAYIQSLRNHYNTPRNITFLDNVQARLTVFQLLRNCELYVVKMYEDLDNDKSIAGTEEFYYYDILYVASLYFLNEYARDNGMSNTRSDAFIPQPYIDHSKSPQMDTVGSLSDFYQSQIDYVNQLAKKGPINEEWWKRRQYFEFMLSIL